MWPFKRKPVLDSDTAGWQFNCFDWLLKEYGADLPITQRRLILPKPGFFATDGEKDHALAERLFSSVKNYAGMDDWPVTLNADAPSPDYALGSYQPQPMKHALGTFSVGSDRKVEITYQPKLLSNPQQLIATFAHELAHYALSTATSKPPCDDDEMEFLTDITAVYLGFGVFLANNVLNVANVHDLGGGGTAWSYGRAGYLPENDLVHATALFLKLSGESAEDAASCLKPGLAKTLRHCLADLNGATEELEKLADDPPPSPYKSGDAPSTASIDLSKGIGIGVKISAPWPVQPTWQNNIPAITNPKPDE
jgi:hypothetical protein